MKIAFIVTDFPAYSQTFIETQIKNIIENGNQIKILANNDPKQQTIQPTYKKYKLNKLTKYYHDNIFESNNYPKNLESLIKNIDKNTDIYHCHFLPTGVSLFKVINTLKIKKPVIISCYGMDVNIEHVQNKFKYLNQPNINFIAISNSIKKKLIYLGIKSNKIWIIPLSVNLKLFKYKLKNKNKITNFVSICRFVEKKGLDDTIKAFSILRNKKINFIYNLYGNGPMKTTLFNLIKKYNLESNIKINDEISHKSILKILLNNDFLIQTSKTAQNGDAEGQTLILQEAQACGLPVISTFHDGIPEGVIHNKTGFLARENNIYDIAKYLLKAIKLDNNEYKKMQINAVKFIKSKYDNEIIKKKLYNFYKQVIKEKNLINKNEKKESIESQINIWPKPPLKILFFNHTAGLGGSERSLLELIDELLEMGVIPYVILPNDGPLTQELDKRFVAYDFISYQWWCSGKKITQEEKNNRMTQSFINLINAKSKLDLFNPDLVFTNTLTIPWGAIYSKMINKPHITFIREYGTLDFNFEFFYGFKESMKFIDNNSQFVFTNSKATLDYFKHFIDNKKLDFAYTYIKINSKLLKEKNNVFNQKNSLKIVLSGGIMPSKGQLDAVLAVKELVNKNLKNIELIIIGGKYDLNYVKKIEKIILTNKLEKNVKIIDFLINPYPVINCADIALMCSKCESYGRVSIEAMALKKPVIGTKSGATKELIRENFNGLFYDYGNYQELAEKIEFFYKNKKMIKKMGQNAFKYYKKTFSKKNYGEKIYKIMKKIIKTKEKNIDYEIIKESLLSLTNKLIEFETKINNLTQILTQKNEELNKLNSTLHKIYTSKTWKLLYWYKKIASFFKKK